MSTDDENALYAQLAAWRAEEAETTQHLLREIADHGQANVAALLHAVIDAVPVWQDAIDQEGIVDGADF